MGQTLEGTRVYWEHWRHLWKGGDVGFLAPGHLWRLRPPAPPPLSLQRPLELHRSP